MKKNITTSFGKLLLALSLPVALIISSCGREPMSEDKAIAAESFKNADVSGYLRSNETAGSAAADSVASANTVYKPMATGRLNDTNHLFMRNADMHCSVKDVRRATFDIESIVRKYDGFVTYTSLSGNRALYYSTRTSKDSVLETYKLNVFNSIVLRVPNENLDSVLIELNDLIEFIDNRTIKADDVKLQLLAMNLKSRRNSQHIKNLNNAVTNQGKKLPQTIDGLNDIDNTKASLDEQQLSILDLKDKVSFSTVKLYVYQPEMTSYKKVAYMAPPDPYTPSFSEKLASTGQTSLMIFQYLLLFFVIIWPFLFVFLAVWFIIKWMIRSRVLSKIFRVQ